MDFLDSRYLTHLDGYLHVFRQPGHYAYRLGHLPAEYDADESGRRFRIEVTEQGRAPGKGQQHSVTLRWDPRARAYEPHPAELAIAANDFVIWSIDASATPGAPPVTVDGVRMASPKAGPEGRFAIAFDSRTLELHDIFTHLFMQPGRYIYRVNQRAEASVTVLDHRRVEPEAATRALQSATVVRIVDGRPNPAAFEIVAGHTVVWFVEEGGSVAITR